eukprot:381379-Prorocentrum_minimum.AAC.4
MVKIVPIGNSFPVRGPLSRSREFPSPIEHPRPPSRLWMSKPHLQRRLIPSPFHTGVGSAVAQWWWCATCTTGPPACSASRGTPPSRFAPS